MAKRKIQKPTRFERMYKVWDYLRKNTDRRHPTSIAKMRKDENINAYIGDKETINRLLKDMANIMNLEDGGRQGRVATALSVSSALRSHHLPA